MNYPPPKWLKIAIPMQTWLKTQGKPSEKLFRRMRRYAIQGRILAPDGSVGAWQAVAGSAWVVHPGATANEPYNGGPRKKAKKRVAKNSEERA